jgi:flagellar basal-body rod protein FlgG
MNGTEWMVSAMEAASTRLDVAAHNLANVSSDGFRRSEVRARLTARGVETRVEVSETQGALRHTGAPHDLSIVGAGTFNVGGVRTRVGQFTPDRKGFLSDAAGRRLLGARGPVHVGPETVIESDGAVRDGDTTTNRIPLPHGTTIRSGFLEGPNTDAIAEMLDVLTAQRAFETAQKTLLAIDDVRQRTTSDVVRLK